MFHFHQESKLPLEIIDEKYEEDFNDGDIDSDTLDKASSLDHDSDGVSPIRVQSSRAVQTLDNVNVSVSKGCQTVQMHGEVAGKKLERVNLISMLHFAFC